MIYPMDNRCQSAYFLAIIALPGRSINHGYAKHISEHITILAEFLSSKLRK